MCLLSCFLSFTSTSVFLYFFFFFRFSFFYTYLFSVCFILYIYLILSFIHSFSSLLHDLKLFLFAAGLPTIFVWLHLRTKNATFLGSSSGQITKLPCVFNRPANPNDCILKLKTDRHFVIAREIFFFRKADILKQVKGMPMDYYGSFIKI